MDFGINWPVCLYTGRFRGAKVGTLHHQLFYEEKLENTFISAS
jgi:hypothetical protein